MALTREYVLKSGLTVTCRQFQPSDSILCASILSRNFRNPPGRLDKFQSGLYAQQMKAYTQSNIAVTAQKRDYRVAEVDGRVVGVMGTERLPPRLQVLRDSERDKDPNNYIIRNSPRAVEVVDFVVAEDWRCQNIGRLLLLAGAIEKFEQGIVHFHAYGPSYATPLLLSAGFRLLESELDSIRWGKACAFYAKHSADTVAHLGDFLGKIQKGSPVLVPA